MGYFLRTRVVAAAVALAAASAACGSHHELSSLERIRSTLGVDLPLAGRDAGQGLAALRAIELAVDRHNAATPNVEVDVLVRDTARGGFQDPHLDEAIDPVFDAAHGADDIRLFSANPKIAAVLGPFESNVASVEAPIARRAGLALITASARADELTLAGSRIQTLFRLFPPDRADGSAGAVAARRLGYKRAYAIDDGEAHGRRIVDAFERTFRREGGRVVAHRAIDGSIATLVDSIRSSRADAVIFGGPGPINILLMRADQASAVLSRSRVALMSAPGFLPPARTPFDYYTIMPAPIRSSAASYYAAAATAAMLAIDRASSACACAPTRSAVVAELSKLHGVPTEIGALSFTRSGELSTWRLSLVAIHGDRYRQVGDIVIESR